jgi:hypothetical protein
MPFDEYLAKRGHCSPSILKSYSVNPVLCKFSERATKAKDEGTAFHSVMDGTFKTLYLRGPDGPCNKNPWAQEKKRLQEENPKLTVLPAAEYDGYIEMSDAVYLNKQVGPLLERISERECSYFWNDAFGVPCKARPDAVTDDDIILDFKSAASVGPEWYRDAHRYQYDLSVAHYLDESLPFFGYTFVVVSKVPPYFVMKWKLDPDAFIDARDNLRRLRDSWNESRLMDSFENRYDQEFTIPRRFSYSREE